MLFQKHVGRLVTKFLDAPGVPYRIYFPFPHQLDYAPTKRYVEASIDEVLHPLIDEAGVILVPGA